MGRLTAEVLAWRARHPVPRPWRAWPRGLATNMALVAAGLAGGFASGFLVGRWMAGLVGIAESGLVLYIGFNREDAQPRPVRGSRTVGQVLEDEAEYERGTDDTA